jgi:hypothetical protein
VVSGIAHPVPWTDESTRQFRLARTAAGRTARIYREAGFAVIIDDVLFPADPQVFFPEEPEEPYAKILLLPPVEVALRRNELTAAPYADAGWIVLDNSQDGGVEEIVDAILERIGLSEN